MAKLRRKRGFIVLWVAWISLSLACNYPGYQARPAGLSVEALRQTMAAPAQADMTRAPDETPASPYGLSTATPAGLPPAAPGRTFEDPSRIRYVAQPGDTLAALAGRFGVAPEQIISSQPVPEAALILSGQEFWLPNLLGETPYASAILPDHAVINSPSAAGFDVESYLLQSGGYLNTYQEQVGDITLSGAQIVQLVANESSINPKILLALLDYQSGWVTGQPADATAIRFPVGFHASGWTGLYKELVIAATHLNIGFYGWRSGKFTEVLFKDGSSARLSPTLNAGSIAVQSVFTRLYDQPAWKDAIYAEQGFAGHYAQMFGDPWTEAGQLEPLFPAGLAQPELALPFAPGERWSLTGGPHLSWKTGSPSGALDFAPVTGERPCAVSRAWVTAPAAGMVTRSDRNAVALDLDGDGFEQTGWVIVFFHLADLERIPAGTPVQMDDHLGHPSCEGGNATGTHVHIARKYNGEWLSADGPLPFVLSGWQVYAGEKSYQGELRQGSQVVVASPVGPRTSIITR